MPDNDRYVFNDDDEDETPTKNGLEEDEAYNVADDPDLAEPGFGYGARSGADGSGVERLLTFEDDKKAGRAEADALFASQLEEATRLGADYQPPAAPLTQVQQAARLAAADPAMVSEFTEMLRAANERTQREARAGTEGYDSHGNEAEPPEPPFNPMSLDPAGFGLFMEAAKSGGASPSKVPAGFTYETWSKAVDSALGKEMA